MSCIGNPPHSLVWATPEPPQLGGDGGSSGAKLDVVIRGHPADLHPKKDTETLVEVLGHCRERKTDLGISARMIASRRRA
jgi:hypothetical protein